MKVKVYRATREVIETDLEYPIYLYFQDCDEGIEEYTKVNHDSQIIVKTTYQGTSIEIENNSIINDDDLTRISNKECFDEAYVHVVVKITKAYLD